MAEIVTTLLKPQQAAAMLGVSTKVLNAEVKNRRLKFILVGKRKRFTIRI